MKKNRGFQGPLQRQAPNVIQQKLQQALALHQQGILSDAKKIYEDILKQRPNHFDALHFLGVIAYQTKNLHQAEELIGRAIKLNPNNAAAYSNRGVVLGDLKRFDEAIAGYDKAIALKPDYAEAYYNRGNALKDLKRFDEAIAGYDKAIALKPDYAEAYYNRGNALKDLKRFDGAIASYDKAIALKPDHAEAYYNRGNALKDLKRHEEAANAYAEVLKIDPRHPFTKGRLLHQKMLSCDWKEVDALITEINEDVKSRKLSADPFGWQGVADSQRSLQLCAKLFNEENYPAKNKIVTNNPLPNHKKIRVGYSSGELRDQATSRLLVGVFELHDNSRFEIYGVDNGWDDKSEIRERINASVHSIIDIRRLSDASAATAIFENEIDILVNLNGYFGEERTGVFANRCSPIQVNYLGFPGTLGANYIDYIIADEHVIPEHHKEFYFEKVVSLPNCYQANDRKKEIGSRIFSRIECGLPETGFVFCCFNNNYKILPDIFDVWMRILKQVESSVLWLLEDNASAACNLRKEAVARGLSSERLIFAKRMPLPDHLARHRQADLF